MHKNAVMNEASNIKGFGLAVFWILKHLSKKQIIRRLVGAIKFSRNKFGPIAKRTSTKKPAKCFPLPSIWFFITTKLAYQTART